ncbi:carboxymuconolactone decarboxylase family protein [Spongiibacter tropicus]|uniref:carboxymuconolactone decarboxylase family protein n=1 Tax=Spongiibacter tropicus TaxID=454602 RepID=UPI0003B2EA1E|nr:carboxymuconolactone decarboxylase family protein [Spongiibacter tropicus]
MPQPLVCKDYDTFRNTMSDAHDALIMLGKSVDSRGLDKTLSELVKLRVSIINRCAFCTQLHLDIARVLNIPQSKLDLISSWRDAGVFSAREAAALEWAEHLTMLPGQPLPDTVKERVSVHFSREEFELLTVTIGVINCWNRIAGGLQFPPQSVKK